MICWDSKILLTLLLMVLNINSLLSTILSRDLLILTKVSPSLSTDVVSLSTESRRCFSL